MFLDIDLKYDNPARSYYPGAVVNVEVLINASLRLRCRSVKVVIKCPYANKKHSKKAEYFHLRQTATFSSNGKPAENFRFEKGVNMFKVEFEVPHLDDDIFKSKYQC